MVLTILMRFNTLMNDEVHSERSWLERLGSALSSEPKDLIELFEILDSAKERQMIDADALQMIKGVISVSKLQVRDIMIPRSQMVIIESDEPLQALLPVVRDSGHSRFPVIGEDRDDILGILLAKDLLNVAFNGHRDEFNIRDMLRPAIFVPESKRLNILLKEFRSTHNHMAIVVDEYGGISGLITIEDVLEEIVGEIEDEHDTNEEEYIKLKEENRYLVNAVTPIEEFNAFFKTEFSDEEFDTIGGLVMHEFGYLPKKNETVILGPFEFVIARADKRRIRALFVSPVERE